MPIKYSPKLTCTDILPEKAQKFIENFSNIVSFPATKNLLYSVGFKTVAEEEIYWHVFYLVYRDKVLPVPYIQMSKNNVVSQGMNILNYIDGNLYPQHVKAILKKDVKITKDKITYDKITIYSVEDVNIGKIIEGKTEQECEGWLYEYYENQGIKKILN